MADELRIGPSELLRKARIDYDADFLKEGVRVLSQALMEMEEHVNAGRHDRSTGRAGQRNGYRVLYLGREGNDRGTEGAEGPRRGLLSLSA